VTVLFCDIVGSTALAERLGEEPMHALINQFFVLTTWVRAGRELQLPLGLLLG